LTRDGGASTRFCVEVAALDHVNLCTARLAAMKQFYTEVLGLTEGVRPAFDFGGAWLYAGERACVHLVEVDGDAPLHEDLRLSHFAFRASDLPALIRRLQERSVAYRLSRPPGWPLVQVHLHDPDGNQLHVDFDEAEG
jgi:catechol 2,3-dioxygenase-like lactoylglutathione lyase family enzyme